MKYLLFLPLTLLLLTACTSEEDRIREEIEAAKYCSQDSDCIIVQSQCPFDCYQAVNKAEAERIEQRINDYDSRCVYGCAQIQGAVCADSRCAVVLENGTVLVRNTE